MKAKLFSVTMVSALLLSSLASPSGLLNAQEGGRATYLVDELDFGVGDALEWETGIFAPFADMGAWVSDPEYGNSGALNLGKVMKDTGIKYFNLGFINAVDNKVDANGVLNWGFGGYEVLSEEHAASNAQYQGIKKSIKTVRDYGGDVTISIGGLNEGNFFQHTNDLDVLVNTYIEIIDGFNLSRIDLDIEGGSQGYAMNELNAKAMKIVQEKTGVEVVITLPVLPEGLTGHLGLPTLQVYLDHGVDVEAVNIMAMCYGASYGDYATGSIRAIDSTMQQIINAYAKVGQTLTKEEAYMKVGLTTSIGFEGAAHPIFTVADSQRVLDHAKAKNINFVSFWSINRDSTTQANSGINGAYEHTDVYLDFQDDTVQPEVPDGNGDEDLDFTNVPVWTRELEALGLYVPGYIVQHNGIVYKQVFSGTAWYCEPGTNPGIWLQIGTVDGGTPEANTAPTISGTKNQTIEFGSSFDALAGVTATDKEDGDLTDSIKVTGSVNTNKAGKYSITYTVEDSKGLTATKTVVITVSEKVVTPEPEVNTAPTISGTKNQTIEFGSSFNALAGVTATDKEDGNLTSAIKVTGTVNTNKAGNYTITYTVADSKGLTASKTVVITVLEKVVTPEPNTAPTISGTKNQTIKFGSSFNALAGVTATDKEDGNLTSSIKVTGSVNTNKAGKYTITYTVTDSKGLKASKTVVITVLEKETVKPEGDYPIWNQADAPKGKYTSGVIVSHKGVIYKQVSAGTAWWTEPGTDSSTWQAIGQDDSYEAPAPTEWNRTDEQKGLHTPGTVVTYKGKTYKQVSSGTSWWCEPGTNSSVWQLQ